MRAGRYIAAVLFVSMMFVSAGLFNLDILIFPEILALLIGMLCTDKVPWKTDGVHTVIMMTLSAFIGVAVVIMVPVHIYFQALIGIVISGLLLMLTNCSLMPCIAACLFPICFNESSLIYPVVVSFMSVIAVKIRTCFISRGKLEEGVKFRYLPDFEEELKLWGLIIVAFAILSAVVMFKGDVLLIVPPLAVTFIEGSYKRLAGKRVKIWFVITVAAVIGALMRYVFNDMLGLPVFIAATIATMLALLEMRLMNMMFPPAGTAVLLAFMAEGNIFLYPPIISAGAAAVLAVSAFINNAMEGNNG